MSNAAGFGKQSHELDSRGESGFLATPLISLPLKAIANLAFLQCVDRFHKAGDNDRHIPSSHVFA
jgi:hypothetical protein